MSFPITIIIAFVVLVTFYVWILYNSLVTAKVRIREALSGIDVQLKRRVDLIPNLVEAVKGYTKHEKQVLENVTKARTILMQAKSPREKAASNDLLSDTLKSLFAVSENYPELKASKNFLQLQEELSDTENKIAYSRQFYNGNVRDYNASVMSFPNNILAQIFGFTEQEFFQTTPEEKKQVKISF